MGICVENLWVDKGLLPGSNSTSSGHRPPPPYLGYVKHNMRVLPTKVDSLYHSGELFSTHMLFRALKSIIGPAQ